jgi:hypothetical protein
MQSELFDRVLGFGDRSRDVLQQRGGDADELVRMLFKIREIARL